MNDDKNKVTIIVNSRPKVVATEEVSYDEVLGLAFDPIPTGPNVKITIAYTDGAGRPYEGYLRPGGSVKVQEGTTFDVDATDNS